MKFLSIGYLQVFLKHLSIKSVDAIGDKKTEILFKKYLDATQ